MKLVSVVVLCLCSIVAAPAADQIGHVRQFEALSLFSKQDSEFFTLTNAHPGPGSYQLLAYRGDKFGDPIPYGAYTKGAFSLSGGVDLKLTSDVGGEIVVASDIAAGAFYMMYLFSNEGQTEPRLGIYQFTKGAIESAIEAGLATIFFVNLVRMRDAQIFVNGVLFVDLPAPGVGDDPTVPQPLTLGPTDFSSVIEMYDSSDPSERTLVVRARLRLEARRVYICHVMGDPHDQEVYPYTMALYKHSLSGAFRLRAPSFLLHIGLALAVITTIF